MLVAHLVLLLEAAAAPRLQQQQPEPLLSMLLYTFGEPRVGDSSFTQTYVHTQQPMSKKQTLLYVGADPTYGSP